MGDQNFKFAPEFCQNVGFCPNFGIFRPKKFPQEENFLTVQNLVGPLHFSLL